MPSTDSGAGCRVCGSGATSSLPIGVYAPFFQLRVDISRDRFAIYSAAGGLKVLGGTGFASKAGRGLSRLRSRLSASSERRFLRTFCDFCSHCRSLVLSHSYGYGDLERLYADYRGSAYNADRISVEPSYAALADLVGRDPKERANRNAGVARFLQEHLPPKTASSALDLGGSDGKFIPPEVLDRFEETHVVDTSDATIADEVGRRGVRKVAKPDTSGYGLAMCMHVLEHVGSPRQFVLDSLVHLQPGGLLYLEVPLELDALTEAQFGSRLVDRTVTIHEHINQFHADSIGHLVNSIGPLRLIKAESAEVDCGWAIGRVGRVLARRVD